jgi:hypothetical protein
LARIAIVLSGFVREQRLQSLEDFVVAPNLAAGHSVSVFVSTWDTYGTVSAQPTDDPVFTGKEYWSGTARTYDNRPLDKAALESALRRHCGDVRQVRYRNYEAQAKAWLAEIAGMFEFTRGKDEHTILRIRSMWRGMLDAFSLIERPEEFDFIVRSRFDVSFREPIVFRKRGWFSRRKVVGVGGADFPLETGAPERDNEHIQRIRSRIAPPPAAKSALLVPERETGYVDDWFAVGTSRSMRAHMTVFEGSMVSFARCTAGRSRSRTKASRF